MVRGGLRVLLWDTTGSKKTERPQRSILCCDTSPIRIIKPPFAEAVFIIGFLFVILICYLFLDLVFLVLWFLVFYLAKIIAIRYHSREVANLFLFKALHPEKQTHTAMIGMILSAGLCEKLFIFILPKSFVSYLSIYHQHGVNIDKKPRP